MMSGVTVTASVTLIASGSNTSGNDSASVTAIVSLSVICTGGGGTDEITVMEFEIPEIVPFAASVAVIVWLPAVFNVADKIPVPLDNVVSAGRIAWASLLVKCTVPV